MSWITSATTSAIAPSSSATSTSTARSSSGSPGAAAPPGPWSCAPIADPPPPTPLPPTTYDATARDDKASSPLAPPAIGRHEVVRLRGRNAVVPAPVAPRSGGATCRRGCPGKAIVAIRKRAKVSQAPRLLDSQLPEIPGAQAPRLLGAEGASRLSARSVAVRIVRIINFKGGIGKSTLATNLAHALARSGTRVLLIDADLQGNSSSLLLR